MYNLIAMFSMIIRQFYISNPFEALGEGLVIHMDGGPILISPVVLNRITEPFMYLVTYAVVGLYYDRGDAPAIGSFLYLLFYCVHTILIWIMSLTGFATWAIALTVIMYIGLHLLLKEMSIRYL